MPNIGRPIVNAGVDTAGRQIAGLLTYNPGPGIYSRLERAIQQMPENVRVQELPGLLKRYKEGVPGWELRETDLDSIIAGRAVVPRSELLARVQERSPVYTHREVVLGGTPVREYDRPVGPLSGEDFRRIRNSGPSRLGEGVSHGPHQYSQYGQGGDDYSELLLVQPGAPGESFGSHWTATPKLPEKGHAVAHARFDTHGDALRINELQSDLGIHNRKARESLAEEMATGRIRDSAVAYDFPLEDAWADLLIKRLALEAARKGHRAIEVASPRAIADKVGGNIDNYEHFYGKVVPGALERLGRKMGGLVEDVPSTHSGWTLEPWDNELSRIRNEAMQAVPASLDGPYRNLVRAYLHNERPRIIANYAQELADQSPNSFGDEMPNWVSLAEREAAARRAWRNAKEEYDVSDGAPQAGRRYIMSDEMRRRLIEQGVGASLLAPLLLREE
jgi:hypothetical protein